ncbi:MAG: hypothetical protein HYX63_13400 [Gammaproteobacteria bacterium]|nr:hypothetical protein [Gammaproteobacteria bacterium]
MSDQLSSVRDHLDKALYAVSAIEAVAQLLSPNDDPQNILQHVDGHELSILLDVLTECVNAHLSAAYRDVP